MQESYNFFLALHVYSLYTNGFLMLFYLFLTQNNLKSEFLFVRNIRLFLPVYYLFLTLTFFTGILLLALNHFVLNFFIILMIVSWILILFLAILHFKQFKTARKRRSYSTFRFVSFVFLPLEIVLLFVPYVWNNFF